MKRALILTLALCIASLAASAAPAWSDEDESVKCMEQCLAPAVASGDMDVLEQAIESCSRQCLPSSNAMEGVDMAGFSSGRCVINCASALRQCHRAKKSTMTCHIQYENCKAACRR